MAKLKERYFTLLVKEPQGKWSPQFGDWDKAVVAQERDDVKDDWPKGSKFRIIETAPSQDWVNLAVKELNA